VIDVSDPSNPTLEGSHDTPGQAMSLMVDGDYAYVADFNSGMQVLRFTGPPIPTLSEWGMLIMALLLLAIGTAAIVRRKRATADA